MTTITTKTLRTPAARRPTSTNAINDDVVEATDGPSSTTTTTTTPSDLTVRHVIEAERRMRLLATPTEHHPRPERGTNTVRNVRDDSTRANSSTSNSSTSSTSSSSSRSEDDELASSSTAPGSSPPVRRFGSLDPLQLGCDDPWRWSKAHRSCEVLVSGPTARTAFFHPNWSKGTAGVRGTKVLNNGRYYWEIHVTNRIFGTSMMFGIGTEQAQLHANSFTNLLGADAHSWGLSHKGIVWHAGTGVRFTKCFKENLATTIGLLFDGIDGTLTYYKDGVCLGIAFRELNTVQEPLYPIVCSTAAKTEMVLAETRREFVNLQDRCRAEICKYVRTPGDLQQLQSQLRLPPLIGRYLAEAVPQ